MNHLKQRYSRKLNILTINGAVRPELNYSQFISRLTTKNIYIDRKILAQLAKNEPLTFRALVKFVKL